VIFVSEATLTEGIPMSTQTEIREEQTATAPTETKSAQQILNQIVGSVRQDSQTRANAYLEEAKVPHGGE